MVASRSKKMFKFEFLEKFPTQIKTLKTVLGHVGLYVGLIAYTALGALVIVLKRSMLVRYW